MTSLAPFSKTLSFPQFDVQLIRSAKRRTLAIEVGSRGVIARAPKRMSENDITDFIHKKRHWIAKSLNALPPQLEPIDLSKSDSVLLLGEHIQFNVNPGQRGQPSFDGRVLDLPVLKSHLPFHLSIKHKLLKWYKATAVSYIQERVEFYRPQLALAADQVKAIKVRDYKRRWGSCDANGSLSFNWRIIMAPPAMLDYVIVHELAHCHEFNHSKRFWAIVEQLMPDWQHRAAWFNSQGASLYRL